MKEMKKKSYRVHVIVDSHHGDRIREIPIGEPAWVVDSTDNQPVMQAIWRERKEINHLEGITSFKVDANATPEDWLVSELATIDLHHGEFSHNPPYSVLKVLGVSPSDRIKKALTGIGLTEIKRISDGFEAKRK